MTRVPKSKTGDLLLLHLGGKQGLLLSEGPLTLEFGYYVPCCKLQRGPQDVSPILIWLSLLGSPCPFPLRLTPIDNTQDQTTAASVSHRLELQARRGSDRPLEGTDYNEQGYSSHRQQMLRVLLICAYVVLWGQKDPAAQSGAMGQRPEEVHRTLDVSSPMDIRIRMQ
ncbi:hypothetical protein EYF80_040741 [Liparis tanakae]|uniref:Uncharacterized protein n=1 Tax=Liparis tanakae TaxID=230148 RepID=A0A4Z2G957_9TELE|nr:hypothetical protein EYF80_040741 [Liparis tanakae]